MLQRRKLVAHKASAENRVSIFLVRSVSRVNAKCRGANRSASDQWRRLDLRLSDVQQMDLLPSVITDSAKRAAIIRFSAVGLTKGQDYLEPLSYARLPTAVVPKEEKAMAKINSASTIVAQR
jgi:hypothetical protein